ncbi:MAG: hypothetical protein ACFFC7_08785 [Candidatus Hermodarchaeota archaeon]
MVDDSSDKLKDSSVIKRINTLNSAEIVKDILRGWWLLRQRYPEEIRKYDFTSQLETECKRLATEFLNKYANETDIYQKSQIRVIKDEGTFNEFYSVVIYGKETYPFFSYPINFIAAESLSPAIFYQVFRNLSDSYVDLEQFTYIFFQNKNMSRARFSRADLQLLNALFSYTVKSQSSIGFPTVPELMQKIDMKFAESTLRGCYRRLVNLGIVHRNTTINYARLRLIPLLKIYNRNEAPKKLENQFSTWESLLPPDKTLWILNIPERSSFWFDHSALDVYILQSRYEGVNINLFDGKCWRLNNRFLKRNSLADKTDSSYMKIDYTLSHFPFRTSDLRLLTEIQISGDRKITNIAPRTDLTIGFVSKRLNKLRKETVFRSYFRLLNAGLDQRYYFLGLGNENELMQLEYFIRGQPRFYITKSKTQNCLFALVWISTEIRSQFLKNCERLDRTLQLDEFNYGLIEYARSHRLDFLTLWDEKKEIWLSEPKE